jgi:hypothetical protein
VAWLSCCRVCLVRPKREDVSLNEPLLSLSQSGQEMMSASGLTLSLPEMEFSLVVQPHLKLEGLTAG